MPPLNDSTATWAEALRRFVGRHQRLRAVLLPTVGSWNRYGWPARNVFTFWRPIRVITRNGSIRLLAAGHIPRVLWQDGFEDAERDFVNRSVGPGMVVLNIGANCGLYAALCGALVGEQGEVHAFEPATVNYGRLVQNVALNGLSNVHAVQKAVSSKGGEVDVYSDPANPTLDSHYSVSVTARAYAPLERVSSTTIDDYWLARCAGGAHRPVDMMIIDVEGAEMDVFLGARQVLASSPGIIIMAECTERLEDISKYLQGLGFRCYSWNATEAKLTEGTVQRGSLIFCRSANISRFPAMNTRQQGEIW